jgi:hypothetical protein
LKDGRRGTWTEEEVLKLEKAVEMHGEKNWAAVAELVPGRTKSNVLADGVTSIDLAIGHK